MWIDTNSLNSTYEKDFLVVVSKCLMLCQKIEKAYKAINSITELQSNPELVNKMDDVIKHYMGNKTLGYSIDSAIKNHDNSPIGFISKRYKRANKKRNYIAHDSLTTLFSIISNHEPIPVTTHDIIADELKEIYNSITPLIDLDDALNCIGWIINENMNPFDLPVHTNNRKKMVKWIFDGFEEKDYLPDEVIVA